MPYISAPYAPDLGLSRKPTTWVVLLGAEDGSAPTIDDEIDWLYPLSVSRLASGERDDYIVFGFNPPQRIVDTMTLTNMKIQIELRALDDEGEPTIVVGWGTFARQPQRIDASSEVATVEVRIGDYHFGNRATAYPLQKKADSNFTLTNRQIVFNPEVDGEIRGNHMIADNGYYDFANGSTIDNPADGPFHYFVDYESQETDQAKTQFNDIDAWTIRRAIWFLCWWLNPHQKFIDNPSMEDLQALDFFTDAEFKNVEIPFGASLPEALDACLVPLEFGWYLDHFLDGNDVRHTSIRFYQRGVGPEVSLGMQRPETDKRVTRDPTETNITSFDGQYSVIDLANRIEVYGEFQKRESTFFLMRGWDQSFDERDLLDLKIGSEFYASHPEVGRLWVFNEDGSYDEVGHGNDLGPIDPAEKLEGLFDEPQSCRRRRFLPCLSTHGDADKNVSNRFVLEYYDYDAPGAVGRRIIDDPGWKRVKSGWPFQVLEKQCGILFEGETPPEILWRLGKAGDINRLPTLRITATVVGDKRVKGVAERLETSPNGLDCTLVLDMKEKFEDSAVDSASKFADSESTAKDDTEAIQEYAVSVQGIEDVLRLDASIELEGCLNPDLSIGDTVPQIKGRNISMELNASGRAPQIVGVNIDCQEQRCELLIETFKRERPRVIATQGAATVMDPLERLRQHGQEVRERRQNARDHGLDPDDLERD